MIDARALLAAPPPRGYPLGLHAFCKLNLGLAVGPRRPDGYHAIDTVLQTVDLADTLYARPRSRGLRLRVVRRGPARGRGLALGPARANLVLRAARRAQEALGERRGAEFLLVKRVPAGSGLGGGSSDAAAALRLVQRLWGRRLGPAVERALARALGSDCAFFLRGGRARATGRGERLRGLAPGPRRRVLLALPRHGVSTAAAYRALDERRGSGRPLSRDIRDLNELTKTGPLRRIAAPGSCAAGSSGIPNQAPNDFEEVVESRFPEIRAAMRLLETLGVGRPRLSGSGSTVFSVLPPRLRFRGVVTRQRPAGIAVVSARFTQAGALWCR